MPRAKWVIQPLKEKSLHFTGAFLLVNEFVFLHPNTFYTPVKPGNYSKLMNFF